MEGLSSQEHVSDREQLARSVALHTGIDDEYILQAFRRVPRHHFVPDAQLGNAHEDRALPIGGGQTISQPSMIALMLDALACHPGDRALEVGAGSGYAAALLGQLCNEVDAIEIRPELAERARRTLAELRIDNVRIHTGDGAQGLSSRAPFDRILVSAGAGSVPAALLDQLGLGGRIAIPVGDSYEQRLMVGERVSANLVTWETRTPCVFVPLIGHSAPSGAPSRRTDRA